MGAKSLVLNEVGWGPAVGLDVFGEAAAGLLLGWVPLLEESRDSSWCLSCSVRNGLLQSPACH